MRSAYFWYLGEMTMSNGKNYHGLNIIYLDDKKAIIDSINGNHINILVEGGESLTLSYPSAFYKTENYRQFLYTEDNQLREKLEKDTKGHICTRCGSYSSYVLQPTNHILICEKCIETEKREYATCCKCHQEAKLSTGGKNCIEEFLCQKCYDRYKSLDQINLVTQGIRPKVTMINRYPLHCKNNGHTVKSVRARVLFYKENAGKRTPHEIDLVYCEECDSFMCYLRDYQKYTDRFGTMLLEHPFKREYLETLSPYYIDYFKRITRNYADDTLLSRWGYIAQDSKQSDGERRAILASIIDYDINAKPEILSILHNFMDYRGDRCYKAYPIWQMDLEFVHNYNAKDPFIDLTEYCQ